MKIQWLGHSCFLFTNRQGGRLLIDPFDEEIGYPVPRAACDVVAVSHGHHDHSHVQSLPEGFVLLDGAGRYAGFGFEVYSVDSWHDDCGGEKRGANRMFVIEADGVRVAHLGDLGQELTAKQIAQMGRVDVLLIPVGGYYTIDAQQAWTLTRQVGPRLTIPMHYRNEYWTAPMIAPVQAFLDLAGGTTLDMDTVNMDDQAELPKVAALRYGNA